MKQSKKKIVHVPVLKLPAGLTPLKGKANAALEHAFDDREIGASGGTRSVRIRVTGRRSAVAR